MNLRRFLFCMAIGGCTYCQEGGFGGPSVLSRPSGSSTKRGEENLGYQYYAGISGVYDNGLTPVSVDSTGQIIKPGAAEGVELNYGVNGNKNWTHSNLNLSYNGSYRHYTQQSFYDGSDNTLALNGSVQLNRKFTLNAMNSVGSVSRALGGLFGFVNTPDQPLGLPSNEIFDNRSYFLNTSEEVIYQQSSRLSFSASGQSFFVRRQSKALVGVDGYGATGTIAYRTSRVSTVDVAYSYLHFDYPRAFGESDIHQVTAGYSRALSKRFQVSLEGGAYRVETIGVTPVALDPATAALFGQTTTTEAFHTVKYLPTIGASIKGSYHSSSFSLDYKRAPNPGNGVYLTSVNESVGVSYSYNDRLRWSFSSSFGYSRLGSIGQLGITPYTTANGGVGANYRLGRNLHLSTRADIRDASISPVLVNTAGFRRFATRVTVGLNYSPGDHSLNIWR